ncbi:uncharacterized protein BROUX77_001689 [Berkeleyomyces rouxiae]|uniref:uncharacterized protein n=1 Tax=Berkeleyomyces rouxiae TaxID=2035830 RepID=UPI003B766C69
MTLSISLVATAALAISQATLVRAMASPDNINFVLPLYPGSSVNSGPESGDGWSAKQVRNTENSLDGPIALAKIYQRYELEIPEDLENYLSRRQKRASLRAPLLDTVDSVYLVPVKVGLPKEDFNLIFDTAWSGVWMLSEKTTNSRAQKPYNPDNFISSEVMEGYTWEIQHPVAGTASGVVYEEFVSIGNDGRSLTSRSQAIQIVNSISGIQYSNDVSGVMGMAFSSMNPIKPEPQLNFFDNVMGKLDEKIFTVDMKNFGIGNLRFGHFDSGAYTGDIGYTDVQNGNGYWNFTIGGLLKDGTTVPAGIKYAVADTASSMVLLPAPYVAAYYAQIPGAGYSKQYGGFVYPCASQVPEFTFEIGGVQISIPGSYIRFSLVHEEPRYCFGGLQSSHEHGFSVIGNIAFKSAFVVFDPVNSKIGWAKKELRS